MSSVSASPTSTLVTAQSSGITPVSLQVPNHQVQQDHVPFLVSKRSATWRYLQRVHQGGMVLYNTAMLSEMDLRRGYADEKMFLRATGRKATLDSKSPEETGEYSLLEVRQLPFNLDYIITFSSLCDMIAQVYEKLGTEDRAWTLTNMELFQKVDNRFKKILTVVSKELESMAREIMVDELNAMDPLGTSNDHDWEL
ncbi:hypothetical protein BGX27_009832 [Mortierella sp. AM989]|nr:hypothetical protein BGX27_009832 [Mortierella sp. AM989]